MENILGIDAGGTKTRFVLYSPEGSVLKETTLESCHPLQVSDETAVSILKKGIAALVLPQEPVFISAGMAGYGNNKKLVERIEQNCAQAFAGHPYALYSDAQIALSGALDGEDGILLIAGTGSMALSRKDGVYQRCGGWGFVLDDAGSSYWIGKELLKAFCAQADGRQKETALKQAVKDYFGINEDYELISTCSGDRTQIAGLARVCSALAEQQDETAADIFRRAGRELAAQVSVLAAAFDKEVPVGLVGGLWNAGSILLDAFQAHLPSNAVIKEDPHDPACGAYLLAAAHQH